MVKKFQSVVKMQIVLLRTTDLNVPAHQVMYLFYKYQNHDLHHECRVTIGLGILNTEWGCCKKEKGRLVI